MLSGSGTVGSVTTTGFFAAQVLAGRRLRRRDRDLDHRRRRNLDFGNNSTYTVQLNGPVAGTGHDQVVVNGAVTIGSSVNLNMSLGYSPSNGQVLRLIDNDGVDPVSGTFSGLPEGQTVTMNASDFQISYVGGTGNDVTLTVTAAAKTWTGAVNGCGRWRATGRAECRGRAIRWCSRTAPRT